jgi:peptidoglycan hydrolase-like protein with peptidoglycan-binding domain
VPTILGIDYASIDNNEPPNWSQAKLPSSDGSMLQFVIMRATYGDWIDTDYLRDFPGIKTAGLLRGAYMYPIYKNSQGVLMTPELLVETMLRALAQGGYQRGKDMPPVIDIESGGSPVAFGVSAEDALKWYERIYELLKAEFGVAPMIYTSGRVWREDLKNLMTEMTDSALWLTKPWPWALHTTAQRSITQAFSSGTYDPEVPLPWGGGNWVVQQYQGDSWGWPGIVRPPNRPGQVDCNRFHTIKEGYRGQLVRWYQLRLGAGLVPDGIFGPKTKQATINFQKAHGLVPDGIIGVKTFVPLSWVVPN